MLAEDSINTLQTQMAAGERSSRDISQAYCDQIAALDPLINAVIELNPEALEIADRLDEERHKGQLRGPLHGIPVMLKDNIDSADAMMTTAGSLALVGHYAEQDAFIVQQLRQAGAVILAKTNLSEWANFRGQFSSSGWSSRGGQTRNPYDVKRSPCGSSSGSAAAVAANLCAAALGTETDGSIICPAAINGIVGIKPTVGLLSRSGIIPIAHSQDTAGPMTRSVADAALMLGLMTGYDSQDQLTARSQGKALQDYTSFLKEDGLKGARLGILRNFDAFQPQVMAVFEQALGVLEGLGAELIDTEMPNKDSYRESEYEVLLYEFKDDLDSYLGRLKPDLPVHSLADVIAFNQAHAEQVMPYFGQERMLAAFDKGGLTDPSYLEALAHNHLMARDKGIDACIQEHQLDALVAPSNGPAWLIDWLNGDHVTGSSSSPAAVSGYPHITVPMGYVQALPVGLSLFSSAYQEAKLIQYAYAFEQASQHRQAPTLEI